MNVSPVTGTPVGTRTCYLKDSNRCQNLWMMRHPRIDIICFHAKIATNHVIHHCLSTRLFIEVCGINLFLGVESRVQLNIASQPSPMSLLKSFAKSSIILKRTCISVLKMLKVTNYMIKITQLCINCSWCAEVHMIIWPLIDYNI